jgi:transcriptional regulator with XRE-family HTH domain
LNEEFARTLSLLRQEKGVSQRAAAGELGISQALLSHYENGIREPGLAFVAKVCDYYQVSADYLLGRTPDRTCPEGTVGCSRHDSALLMRTADALQP